MAKANHRGRFQAQHVNFCESEAWAQEEPLTAADGHTKLSDLRAKLPPAERLARTLPFQQAAGYIDMAARAGGVSADSRLVKKSYPCPRRNDGCRVDIEVNSGLAFV